MGTVQRDVSRAKDSEGWDKGWEQGDLSLSLSLFLLNFFPTLWLCTALHYLNAWNRQVWIWQSTINAVTVGLGLLSTWIFGCDYCTYQLWLFFHRLKLLMRSGNTNLLSHYHSCQTLWKTFRFARKPEHDDSLNHRQPVGQPGSLTNHEVIWNPHLLPLTYQICINNFPWGQIFLCSDLCLTQ